MSDYRLLQMKRAQTKALNELMLSECKNPQASPDTITTYLENGAQLDYKHCEALRLAVKYRNLPLVKFLIEKGILEHETAVTYLSQIFLSGRKKNEQAEADFFEILDFAYRHNGNYIDLLSRYINSVSAEGRLDKIQALKSRYYLTESEIVSVIELRVLFEMVHGKHTRMLAFVEKHKNWFVQDAYDLSVEIGDWIVLDYLIDKGGYVVPQDKAVAKAVFSGYVAVLTILISYGYDFERKPIFLEKAWSGAKMNGTSGLRLLLTCGYTLSDTYNGKTIAELAKESSDQQVQSLLKEFL